ncbi:MAG TPA: hypothetical protein VEG33_20260, partial [Streptosporangiaceae bacterium]|nr:hypothetical protein [Streptosporangiaceae bacterium]
WGVDYSDDGGAALGLMLRNLAAVVSNYREAGISVFVLAYFVSGDDELRGIREAVGVPLPSVGLGHVSGQIKFFLSCGGQPGCDVPVEGAVELPPGGGER